MDNCSPCRRTWLPHPVAARGLRPRGSHQSYRAIRSSHPLLPDRVHAGRTHYLLRSRLLPARPTCREPERAIDESIPKSKKVQVGSSPARPLLCLMRPPRGTSRGDYVDDTDYGFVLSTHVPWRNIQVCTQCPSLLASVTDCRPASSISRRYAETSGPPVSAHNL
jgi:hypothetical protein